MRIKAMPDLVEKIELEEMYVEELNSNRKNTFIISPEKPANIKVESKIQGYMKNNKLYYEIDNIVHGVEKNKKNPFFEISIKYKIIFSLSEKCTIDENLIKRFGNISVMNMVYPFVREKVLYLTSSMNIPPLLLALHKIFIDKKNNKENNY